jgi:hypothetical protein
MNILINQPAGIGDIIFCQKIAKIFETRGNTVVWPIAESINYLKDYIIFSGLGRAFNSDKVVVVDLDKSFLIDPNESVLKVKYKYCNLDWSDWRNYVSFNRNTAKELELFNKVCPDSEYVVINNFVGTPPNHVKYNIPEPKNKKIVYMDILDDYNVFDWCMVLENASEIYTIDTSINYIIEFLNIKASKLECYSRFKPSNFKHIEGLWKTNWNYKTWENT